YLEAKVASLSRSVALIEEQIASTVESIAILKQRRHEAQRGLRLAVRARAAATGQPLRRKRSEGTGVRGKGVQKPAADDRGAGRPAGSVPADTRGRKRGRPAGRRVGQGE